MRTGRSSLLLCAIWAGERALGGRMKAAMVIVYGGDLCKKRGGETSDVAA